MSILAACVPINSGSLLAGLLLRLPVRSSESETDSEEEVPSEDD